VNTNFLLIKIKNKEMVTQLPLYVELTEQLLLINWRGCVATPFFHCGRFTGASIFSRCSKFFLKSCIVSCFWECVLYVVFKIISLRKYFLKIAFLC
jgi:hypothetical protein